LRIDLFYAVPPQTTAVRTRGLTSRLHTAAHDFAFKAMRPRYGSATLARVNDMRGHAAVLALIDEVIAAESWTTLP
jgi:hypothetical protein